MGLRHPQSRPNPVTLSGVEGSTRKALLRRGNPPAGAARFAQADCNGLLSAFYFLTRASGLELTALHLVHRTLNLFARLRSILAYGLLARAGLLSAYLLTLAASVLQHFSRLESRQQHSQAYDSRHLRSVMRTCPRAPSKHRACAPWRLRAPSWWKKETVSQVTQNRAYAAENDRGSRKRASASLVRR